MPIKSPYRHIFRKSMDVEVEPIAILLAAYNGGKYIEEQLQSLLDQNYVHIHVFIRDDGSTDKTQSIIEDFVHRHPHKITHISSSSSLGAKGNFSALMDHIHGYQYVMFCDQDDVWQTDKTSLTLAKMKELEKLHGKTCPLLVHTDLKVVNAQLELLNSSFWNFSQLFPNQSQSLNRLIVQNVVTGCTMMLNYPLLKLSTPIPSEAIMHDWWIALTASAFGYIATINSSTILYRQHFNNALGAQHFISLKTLKKGIDRLGQKKEIPLKYRQAEKFLAHFHSQLNSKQLEMLNAFISQPKNRWAKKRYVIFKYRFFKNGLLRNIAQLLCGIHF